MTGPDHYRKAEELTAKAHDYLGQGEGQDSAAVWAAVAQIHATLALAAATALGTTAADGYCGLSLAGLNLEGRSLRADQIGNTSCASPSRAASLPPQ
jgi:hypothetical protein